MNCRCATAYANVRRPYITHCTGCRGACYFCVHVTIQQGFEHPLPATALGALMSFLEGDVFRGSRRMPLHDAIHIITEDTLATIPGLLPGSIATLRIALRSAKQSYPALPMAVLPFPSYAFTAPAPPMIATVTSSPRSQLPPPLPPMLTNRWQYLGDSIIVAIRPITNLRCKNTGDMLWSGWLHGDAASNFTREPYEPSSDWRWIVWRGVFVVVGRRPRERGCQGKWCEMCQQRCNR